MYIADQIILEACSEFLKYSNDKKITNLLDFKKQKEEDQKEKELSKNNFSLLLDMMGPDRHFKCGRV